MDNICEQLYDTYGPNMDFIHQPGDIKNMYTALPHHAVLESVRWLLRRVAASSRHKFVSVHKWNQLPTVFGKSIDLENYIIFKIEDLLDIVKFDLNNCVFTVGDVTLRQVIGIAMGSPLSPILAILVCAYYENKFLVSLSRNAAARVKGVRYVDDTDFFVAFDKRSPASKRQAENLLSKLINSCYHKDMVVKPEMISGNTNAYLECLVSKVDCRIFCSHNNKNITSLFNSNKQLFLKYHHYFSFAPLISKKGVINSTLLRIKQSSSTLPSFCMSIIVLMHELRTLSYPWSILLCCVDKILVRSTDQQEISMWQCAHDITIWLKLLDT